MECHFCRNANLNHCIVPQGLSWTDLDNIGAGCFQMNVCALSADYLVSLSCRKWRSELSKCRDLASKCGSSHRKLHRFGTFFISYRPFFFLPFFPFHLGQWRQCSRQRRESGPCRCTSNVTYYVCCWSAILQE